jgi:outer membrane murein-binding lipoprotein Lpp
MVLDFLKAHWRTVLQTIAWVLLFIAGGSSLGGIGADMTALKNQVQTLTSLNEALQQTVSAQSTVIEHLKSQIDELRKENEFLMECLTNPMPWPGGQLCPKPNLEQVKRS